MVETARLLYEIRVELKDVEPPIWRELQVPADTSLPEFHQILQRAMGWTDSHLYQFEVDEKLYGEPSTEWESEVPDSRGMTLEKIFSEGSVSFLDEYDMGDRWQHEITLPGTVRGDGKPLCTAGARACPPEDCGGAPGYYQLLVAL